MISAVSALGVLSLDVVDGGMDADKFIDLLEKLRYDAGCPIFVIADNAKCHHSKRASAFLDSQSGQIMIAFLPPYSPELNPDEQVWNHAKAEAGKRPVKSKQEMEAVILAAMQSIEQKVDRVKSFFYLTDSLYAKDSRPKTPRRHRQNAENRIAVNRTAQQYRLTDGRQLGFAEYGDPKGRTVLYFHGFPSSRLEAAYCDDSAQRLGVRVISIDRPGYGLSEFQPERRIREWPDDVAQLTTHLGIDRFAVLGISGGGPYALACAWKSPQLLSAVKVIGGLGPLHDPVALGAMRWNARLSFGLARRPGDFAWQIYGFTAGHLIRAFPRFAYALQRQNGSAADRSILDRCDIHAILQGSVREGLHRGPRGAIWDAVLYAQDWGIPLEQIEIPVEFWHGGTDRIVPMQHAQMLAGKLPNASLRLFEREGHYSLPVTHCEAILS